jgi:restriction system protein
VDLVMMRGAGPYPVQCRHWRSWSARDPVVRELKGVIAVREAVGGFVVTSGRFTAEALAFATKAGIQLVDGRRLAAMIQKLDGWRPREGDERPAEHRPYKVVRRLTLTAMPCPRPVIVTVSTAPRCSFELAIPK